MMSRRAAERTAALLLALVCVGGAAARTVVVSPGGLTPAAARDAVRGLRRANPSEKFVVTVKPGVYELAETLVFTAEDSGVAWRGEGRAVLAGGSRVTGWREEGDGVVSAPAPRRADGSIVYFEQLWVNGRRAARSVYPSAGWTNPAVCTETAEDTGGKARVWIDRVAFTNAADRAFLAALARDELPYVKMCLGVKWSWSTRSIDAVEPAGAAVRARAAVGWLSTPWKKWGPRARVTFENARAGFRSPGDWLYDVPARRIRYRLRAGEDAATMKAVAPLAGLTQLVRLDGARNMSFSGLTFTLTAVTPSREDAALGKDVPAGVTRVYARQSASSSDAAVMASHAVGCRFSGCRVTRTGNYAFRFGDGCVSNVISRCRMDDLGAGGVWIGASSSLKKGRVPVVDGSPDANRFNRVADCVVRGGGRTNAEGAGIVVANAADCVVTRNEISDLFYTGVSVGWSWGYGGSSAQRNTVTFNRIHDLGQGRMDDLGGIYTLGTSFGTRIASNTVWNISRVDYGGWGIYSDEGSEGVLIEGNVVSNAQDGCYHLHFGVGNTVRGNDFRHSGEGPAIVVSRTEKDGVESTVCFEDNTVRVESAKGSYLSEKALVVKGQWKNNVWMGAEGAATRE